MTTVKELRDTLNAVEPGFRGVEVDAIVQRAHRIRRRNRIAGAALATAVAAGGVAVGPQLHPRLPQDSATAALPWPHPAPVAALPAPARDLLRRPLRLKSGPLPAVNGQVQVIDFADGEKGWLAPPLDGNDSPQFCHGDPGDQRITDCTTLRRSADGVLWSTRFSHGERGRFLAFVVDGPVAEARAADSQGAASAEIRDLGHGYTLVVGTLHREPPLPQPITEVLAVLDAQEHVLARTEHVESRAARQSELEGEKINGPVRALPRVKAEGPHVQAGDGDVFWMAPPVHPDETAQLCSSRTAPANTPRSCENVTSPNNSRIFSSQGSTGEMIQVTILTTADVATVKAVQPGETLAGGTAYDLGQGYRLVQITVRAAGPSVHREVRGYAMDGHEVLRSTIRPMS